MEMEAARPHHNFFRSPSPHHLAELRMEPAHSAVAFSAPGAAAAGRKRRCLLPAVSPRKKMLLELHPFDSAPSYSPPPSSLRSPATAPPLLSRVASPASDFSFQPALAWSGGCGGGNIFTFLENAPTTPSPAGSNASGVTFLASPGQPRTPTGSTASGVFAFLTSTKQPGRPTGPTANGGFLFMTSPEQPLTPPGSTAGGGLSSLSTELSLSPREYHGGRAEGAASTPSPKHARTGSTDRGGLAFFPSPGPAIGHTGSPASPVFVFSASRTSAPPVRKSGGASNKRSRQHLGVATAGRKSLRHWEGPQQVTAPPHKVAKAGALATGEASRSSIQTGSSAGPCCTFFTSPVKASKQEAKKASRSPSPAGSRCTFAASPARPSSVGKASKQEGEVEVSSVAREGPTPTSPAACPGTGMVVRVTCTCGVHKEFSFDHCH